MTHLSLALELADLPPDLRARLLKAKATGHIYLGDIAAAEQTDTGLVDAAYRSEDPARAGAATAGRRARRRRDRRPARPESAALNAALQVGYFIVGVRAADLAADPMTGFDTEGINKEFFADGELSVLAVVNIGKPGENAWFARSLRLTYADVVTTV